MKFLSPSNYTPNNFISDKINFTSDKDYHKVIATQNIKKGELLMIETPKINLFGEDDIDRGLQTIKKYILEKESELYPRDMNNFPRTEMIKDVHKIIRYANNKLGDFFSNYTKTEIEFYYAKYIFNAFEGSQYGPLTLPKLAKFNHTCDTPDIIFKFDKNNGNMYVYANKDIKKNSEIFNSYLMNKNISSHKTYLHNHYAFTCSC